MAPRNLSLGKTWFIWKAQKLELRKTVTPVIVGLGETVAAMISTAWQILSYQLRTVLLRWRSRATLQYRAVNQNTHTGYNGYMSTGLLEAGTEQRVTEVIAPFPPST
jgi:hypothetical protein